MEVAQPLLQLVSEEQHDQQLPGSNETRRPGYSESSFDQSRDTRERIARPASPVASFSCRACGNELPVVLGRQPPKFCSECGTRLSTNKDKRVKKYFWSSCWVRVLICFWQFSEAGRKERQKRKGRGIETRGCPETEFLEEQGRSTWHQSEMEMFASDLSLREHRPFASQPRPFLSTEAQSAMMANLSNLRDSSLRDSVLLSQSGIESPPLRPEVGLEPQLSQGEISGLQPQLSQGDISALSSERTCESSTAPKTTGPTAWDISRLGSHGSISHSSGGPAAPHTAPSSAESTDREPPTTGPISHYGGPAAQHAAPSSAESTDREPPTKGPISHSGGPAAQHAAPSSAESTDREPPTKGPVYLSEGPAAPGAAASSAESTDSEPPTTGIEYERDITSNPHGPLETSTEARDEIDMQSENYTSFAVPMENDELALVHVDPEHCGPESDEEDQNLLTEALADILEESALPLRQVWPVPPLPSTSREVTLAAMLALEGLRDTYGGFTYYQLFDSKIVLHAAPGMPETFFAQLREDFHRVLSQHIRSIELLDTNVNFNSALCGNGIGSTVIVRDKKQTVGMYVVYDGGLIYLLTTAHNYAEGLSDQTANRINLSIEVTAGIEQGGNYSNLVKIGKTCASCSCLAYINPRLALMHYADVMACPKPELFPEINQNWVDQHRSLRVFRDYDGSEFSLRQIHFFEVGETTPHPHSTSFALLKTSWLLEKILICLPRGKDHPIRGMVIACNFSSGMNPAVHRDRAISLYNTVIIKPLGRASPAHGDCGSIWVYPEMEAAVASANGSIPKRGEAVAMTVGSGTLNDGTRVWLAALLHACLQELCYQHPNDFRNPRLFSPF